MGTADTSRLADLRAWLETHACYDVCPCTVRIGTQEWAGCEYKQDATPSPGARNQAPYTVHALYLLGDLRPSFVRSSHECYPWESDGREWYVAGHTPLTKDDQRTQEQKERYAPFGACFYLRPWEVPDGTRIDQYEEKPYRRAPMTVEFIG